MATNDVEQKENGLEIQEEESSVVNGQIIYREKESHKEVSKALRVNGLPANEIVGGGEGRVLSVFDIYGLDADAGQEEISNKVNKDFNDDDFYAGFVDGFVESRTLSADVRDKMIQDPVLREKFLLHLKAKKIDYKTEGDVRKALADMNSVLSKYTYVTDTEVGVIFLNKRNERNYKSITRGLSKSGNLMSVRQASAYKNWKRGRISKKQYNTEMQEIYTEAVENSGDEELKEMWEEQQEFDLFTDYIEKEKAKEAAMNDGLVSLDKKEVKKVNATVKDSSESDSFVIKFNDRGVANVETPHCSLVVRAKKDIRTNEFVYFIEDNYSNDGSYGPINNPEKLQFIIDGRQIDAFMTDSVVDPKKQSEFNGLGDDLVMDVALKLIGNPDQARNFTLRESDRGLLSKLVSFLTDLDVENLNGMGSKLKKINTFMSDEEGVENIRRLFRQDDWEGVEKAFL